MPHREIQEANKISFGPQGIQLIIKNATLRVSCSLRKFDHECCYFSEVSNSIKGPPQYVHKHAYVALPGGSRKLGQTIIITTTSLIFSLEIMLITIVRIPFHTQF